MLPPAAGDRSGNHPLEPGARHSFADSTFDVVYHSHFLEHLERSAVKFLGECYRVLKPGGILRIVVPDLEKLVILYREAMEALDKSGDTSENEAAHENAIADLFDQVVRMGNSGTAEQKPWVRTLERLIRGSAADTGENHRWMYDRHSLSRVLSRVGFTMIRERSATTSRIVGWERCFLDSDPDGTVYKVKSLYLEATKRVWVEPREASEREKDRGMTFSDPEIAFPVYDVQPQPSRENIT